MKLSDRLSLILTGSIIKPSYRDTTLEQKLGALRIKRECNWLASLKTDEYKLTVELIGGDGSKFEKSKLKFEQETQNINAQIQDLKQKIDLHEKAVASRFTRDKEAFDSWRTSSLRLLGTFLIVSFILTMVVANPLLAVLLAIPEAVAGMLVVLWLSFNTGVNATITRLTSKQDTSVPFSVG